MTPLGPQLAAAVRARHQARQQWPAWLAPLAEVLARVQRPPLGGTDRFVRTEAQHLSPIDGPSAAAPPAPAPLALPDGVRERLRHQLGPVADRLRVHDDDGAHRVAREHQADAVSLGADVFFARGRYQPHDSQGFALLAHEAVHVAHATHPQSPWQRGTGVSLAREEASALAVERSALHRLPTEGAQRLAPSTWAAGAPTAPAPVAALPSAQRPMAAATDRSLDLPPPTPALDMDALRETLMRDLMRQIRSDLERGG